MPTRFDLEWDDPIGHFSDKVGLDLLLGSSEIGDHLKKTKEQGKEDARQLQRIKEWIEAVLTDENIPEIRQYGDRGVKKTLHQLELFYKFKFHKLPDGMPQQAIPSKDQTNQVKQKSPKKRDTISDKALKMRDEGKDWREEIAPSCIRNYNSLSNSQRRAKLKQLQDGVYSQRRRNKRRAMSLSHN